MCDSTPAWHAAAQQLADELIRIKADWKLRYTIWRLGKRLRSNDDTWGQYGFALNAMNRYRACWSWMKDWEQRPGAEPWALFNAHQAAWRRHAYDEVRKLGEAALQRKPDHSLSLHLVWHAATVLLFDGDFRRASELLGRADRSQCKKPEAAVWAMIEPCIAALGRPRLVDSRERNELLRAQRAAVAKYPQTLRRDPEARQVAYRSLERVARHVGRTWLACWYRWRRGFWTRFFDVA
jgi:hypothetical protein